MAISDYPEVVALKSMMTTANISGGTTYQIYDISKPPASISYPCFIIDSDEDISYEYNVTDGTLVVAFYDKYNTALTPNDNILALQSKLRSFVTTLKTLQRQAGYIVEPRFKVTPGAHPDSNATIVTNTAVIFSTFYVTWGLHE